MIDGVENTFALGDSPLKVKMRSLKTIAQLSDFHRISLLFDPYKICAIEPIITSKLKLYGVPDSHGERSNNMYRTIRITSISDLKISLLA